MASKLKYFNLTYLDSTHNVVLMIQSKTYGAIVIVKSIRRYINPTMITLKMATNASSAPPILSPDSRSVCNGGVDIDDEIDDDYNWTYSPILYRFCIIESLRVCVCQPWHLCLP